nr:hypothetical protein Iba_scaffold30438CG0010 [Ipomoea batatas]GME17347.1 hypothetical protein Iba_scaffold18603CG0010 [Ipomoea batatas]
MAFGLKHQTANKFLHPLLAIWCLRPETMNGEVFFYLSMAKVSPTWRKITAPHVRETTCAQLTKYLLSLVVKPTLAKAKSCFK